MEKIVFYAVVILYNTRVRESITLNNLKKIESHELKLLIIDNSTKEMGNEKEAMYNCWTYISMNGNAGISKAYNKALDFLKDKEGIIVWFDDDTNVTQEYFDVLELEIQKHEDVDIFAPMILGQDGKFCSPNEYHVIRNKQLKNKNDEIDYRRFNAINSCTAVRTRLYENYRYTEKLFLDQVDHQFFEDQRKIGRNFMKIDVIIHHNLSTKNKSCSIEKAKVRYSIMIPDFLIYSDKSMIRYLLCWMKIIGWGIKESIRYKAPSFLVWCITTAWKEAKEIGRKKK